MAKKRLVKGIKGKGRIPEHRRSSAALDGQHLAIGLTAVAGLILICFLTLIAYIPSLHGELLWDDAAHVTSPALQSIHGLWRIWSDLSATQQYYPVLHTAFWVEHRFWGDEVLGYHLINIVLHSITAWLVVLLLQRLHVHGAWLAGLIFALHPVCVESVAWISEQKNTLSAVFCLWAGLIYLSFDDTRRRSSYFWATSLFALALLSKTVAATLPVALLIVFWWQRRRFDWKRDVLPLLPWLGLGASAGLFTSWIEMTHIGAQGSDFSLTFLQRCLLAGRAIWFYMSKLIWPSNLTFVYPRWTIDSSALWQYLFLGGFVVLLVGLWVLSLRWRGPLAGFLFFAVTLFPALGFLNVFPFLYSYVADHFQYLASLGVITPIASGLVFAAKKLSAAKMLSESRLLKGKSALVEAAVCGALLLPIFLLTLKQSGMYSDSETLWRTTIARNPRSSMVNNNLCELLFAKGRVDEAQGYCRKAVELKPENAEANGNLANTLRYMQRFDEAIVYYEKASKLKPNVASFHGSLASTCLEVGRIEEAVAHYEIALKINPSQALIANNLAWILATCPQASVRNGARAVELAQRANLILGGVDPTVIGTVAAAYAEVGRFEDAVAAAEKAHALATSTGNTELVDWNAQLLETFRSRTPYREISLLPKEP